MRKNYGEYVLSDEKDALDLGAVCALLGKTYWAEGRSQGVIGRSIEHSLCYGAYLGGEQVAFARVVSDHAVMYWLCDVVVDEHHRGRGIGTALVRMIVESPELVGLTGILRTRDAHVLYERFGFERDGDRFMRKKAG